MLIANRPYCLIAGLIGRAGIICWVALASLAGAQDPPPATGTEVVNPDTGNPADSLAKSADAPPADGTSGTQPPPSAAPATGIPAAPADPGLDKQNIAPSLAPSGAGISGTPMVIPGVVPFAPVPELPAGTEVPGGPPAPVAADGSVVLDPLTGLPAADPMSATSEEPDPQETVTPLPASASQYGGSWSPTYGLSPMFGGRSNGFSEVPMGFGPPGGFGNPLLDGFAGSVSLTGTYDSNPSQGYGQEGGQGGGDFYLTLGGTVSYLTKAPDWTFGVTYSGGYNQFFDQSDLSGYFQNAGASVNYDGGRLSASLRAGLDFGSGANRYYASVVDQISVSTGLSARYRFSSKTSITGDVSYQFTSASGNSYSDTGSFDIGSSAIWHYSDLTEFGPGIRGTVRTGDFQEDRTTIGPTFTVNYILTSKVSLNSRIGVDFVEYGNGESGDPALSAAVGCTWQASRLWGLDLSLYQDAEADPSWPGAFSEITSLRLGYHRRLKRAMFNCGVSYETNTAEGTSPDAGIRPDRDYFTIDGSIGMPVFADTCNANLFTRYRDEDGGSANSWDSVQIGFGLVRQF